MKILWLFIALSFLAALPFAAAQDASSDTTLTADPIYQKNCAKCHGKSAEGRHLGGPSLISAKVASASADDLRNMITNGKGRMPKYSGKLSSEEINRLILEIKAANTK